MPNRALSATVIAALTAGVTLLVVAAVVAREAEMLADSVPGAGRVTVVAVGMWLLGLLLVGGGGLCMMAEARARRGSPAGPDRSMAPSSGASFAREAAEEHATVLYSARS